MKHNYEVLVYTGDAWGRGCAPAVSFEIVGSEGHLLSTQCKQEDLGADGLAMKRARALEFAVGKARVAAGKATAAGPPLEKRNIFDEFSAWLQSSGGAKAVQELVRSADTSASQDGLLDMNEVKQLLAKAVPSVSDVETQLFMAMVDVNGDGQLSEAELTQSVADCANIDAIVIAGGNSSDTALAAITPANRDGIPPQMPPGSATTAGMVDALAVLVQHLRSNVAAVNTKIQQLNPAGGFLTFTQLNELFKEVVPETFGGRGALRALLAHVARTAYIAASDPGVHVQEFRRCFGLEAWAPGGSPQKAAVAAGWVPGRPRDIFRLLRYHVKHNHTQLDKLYPRGGPGLKMNQVRHLIQQILSSRTGEPPLTGREARLLMAVLDVNGNHELERGEFDAGLKECRDLAAAMSRVRGTGLEEAGLDPATPLMPPVAPAAAGEASSTLATWGSFRASLKELHDFLAAQHLEMEAEWRARDSRKKGRIDVCELKEVLIKLAPTSLLPPAMLRGLLIYLDNWDASEHALLSRKHFLMALRGQPAPGALQPVPTARPVDAVEVVPNASVASLSDTCQRLSSVLYGARQRVDQQAALPDLEIWRQRHGNDKAQHRPTEPAAAWKHNGFRQPLSSKPGNFWKAQRRWHAKWLRERTPLAAVGEGEAGATQPGNGARPPPVVTGEESAGQTANDSGGAAASKGGASSVESAKPDVLRRALEARLWPRVTAADARYLHAALSDAYKQLPGLGLDPDSTAGTAGTPTDGMQQQALPAAAGPKRQPVEALQHGGVGKPQQEAPPAKGDVTELTPVVVPTRVLRYQAADQQLGIFQTLTIRGAACKQAWYLEKVEVRCTSTTPPLMWEVTVRSWLQPFGVKEKLVADPCAWEEWDMQVDPVGGTPAAVLHYNSNRRECSWQAPPPAPMPGIRGAVPYAVMASPLAAPQQGAPPGHEWLLGGAPTATQRSKLRHLDTLREPPMFRPTRVRPNYGIGFGGDLGIIPGWKVHLKGNTCNHSIAVQARGGFKWVDPEDELAPEPKLPPVTTAAAAGAAVARGGSFGSGEMAPPPAAPEKNGASREQNGGSAINSVPGVRECVVLTYNLEAAGRLYGEQYVWLYTHVALDDSSSCSAAGASGTWRAPAVRFCVVKDETLVWAAWVKEPGEVLRCCVQLQACRLLHLVVECDFSGAAHCVWLDPALVCDPLPADDLAAALMKAPRLGSKVVSDKQPSLKVDFRHEADGDVVYMAPSSSIPIEVARSTSTANYRIAVYTCAEKGSGTKGNVYISLSGHRIAAAEAVPVKATLVYVNSDGLPLTEGDKYVMPNTAALPYMDEVDSITLQHVPPPAGLIGGSRSAGGANDWRIQHVEVYMEETGRTWYFVANSWFLELANKQHMNEVAAAGTLQGGRSAPLQPADARVRLDAVSSAGQLKVVFHIMSSGKGAGMGVDGDLEMVLVAKSNGEYRNLAYTLPGQSINRTQEARLLPCPPDLGDLQSLELSCKHKGLLITRLQAVEVIRLKDGKQFLFLPPQPDPYDQSGISPNRIILRSATQPYFRISTFTSKERDASTDARVYIDLFGSQGKLLDLHLRDPTGDCFNEGAEDVFFFPDPGLGDIGSVCVSHDDSGESPNWLLDRVEITNTGSQRTTTFECKKWIGLRAEQQDKDAGRGKFGDERVLERVLYPSGRSSHQKADKPTVLYHMVLKMSDSKGELWHAVESLQLVGKVHTGGICYSDAVILEKTQRYTDIKLDMMYIRQKVQQGNQGSTSTAATGPTKEVKNFITYQVVVRKNAVHQLHPNIMLGDTNPREVNLTLHGSKQSSNRPLILGPSTCTSTGLLPFTTDVVDDVFQVSTEHDLGDDLLRAEIQVSGAMSLDWGILLQSITVRKLSDTSQPVEFGLSESGQWLGASPQTVGGVTGGAQVLHLLPAGTRIASFRARHFDEIIALHIRHDNPQLLAGWDIESINVVSSRLPGDQPTHVAQRLLPEQNPNVLSATAVGEALDAPASASAAGEASTLKVYYFPGSKHQRDLGWPSPKLPFIRHFLTEGMLLQSLPVDTYFKAPLQPAIPELHGALLAGDALAAMLNGTGSQSRKAGGDDALQAEVEKYTQLADMGGADLFAMIRARIRADPDFFLSEFSKEDEDRDGKLNSEQVTNLCRALLPQAVGTPSMTQLLYISTMLTLCKHETLNHDQLSAAVKDCHNAYKEAASMDRFTRLLKDGSVNEIQTDEVDVQFALCNLAEQLVQPSAAMNATEVFKTYDTDGSGYLEVGELCRALRNMQDPKLTDKEVRLLLAYLFHYGDKDRDMRLSVTEVQSSLMPFVPRPPAKQLDEACNLYKATANLPAFLARIHKLQPALLPAACATCMAQLSQHAKQQADPEMQLAGQAILAEAASGNLAMQKPNEPPSVLPAGSVYLSMVPGIVSALVPKGMNVPNEHSMQLQLLIGLGQGPSTSLTVEELAERIKGSADAMKRAAGIDRAVGESSAIEEQQTISLESELGGAETVLNRLSDLLVEDQAESIAQAFKDFDQDGSGFLDAPELCRAIWQAHPALTNEELRTLLAYIHMSADKHKLDYRRLSLENLQVILKPFR